MARATRRASSHPSVVKGRRENVGPAAEWGGALAMKDTEKAELQNASFASAFTAKTSPQESQALETKEEV